MIETSNDIVSAVPAGMLKDELMLPEYGTCLDQDQADLLYQNRLCLKSYFEQPCGCLTLAFKDDRPCIRATGNVGVLPYEVDGKSHLLLIAPKGCEWDMDVGLVRFLELLVFDDRDSSTNDEFGWEGIRGSDRFLLFLARHYANLLKELCHRDFRAYYRPEADDLRSNIRGRLRPPRYARLSVQGKQHLLPCRWDEFTVDNWDNRILWAAARRLKGVAAALDPQAAEAVWHPFRPLLSWFGAVSEIKATVSDFRHSRLGRTSAYYRRALDWARLLLQGSSLPGAGGQVPPIILKAPLAFEKFAQVVVQAALPEGWKSKSPRERELAFLSGPQSQIRIPDILLSSSERTCAVGDAKYKDVLERVDGESIRTIDGILKSGIKEGDWNQLYVYMRLCNVSFGFFIVPIWNADGDEFAWMEGFQFAVSACDEPIRVAVLALNLLKPLKDVKCMAAEKLRAWLSDTE